jgi:hypothetical protein
MLQALVYLMFIGQFGVPPFGPVFGGLAIVALLQIVVLWRLGDGRTLDVLPRLGSRFPAR